MESTGMRIKRSRDISGSKEKKQVCRCNHESNQIETFSCRRTKPERRPQTKDGQAPVPRVRVFPNYEPTQIRTKLVDSLWPAGLLQPSHFLLRSQVSKWALLATHDLGFLENPAPVS